MRRENKAPAPQRTGRRGIHHMSEATSGRAADAVPGNWIAIGRLLRARGNRGELVGELDSSDPRRADRLHEVTLESNGRRKMVRVEQVWRNQAIYEGRPVFKFEGIDSISDAEAWEGAAILVAETEVAKPGEGEYSFADLIGSRVLELRSARASAASGGTAGAEIGVVERIEEYGGAPLLAVRGTGGREILIPFARSICKQIDAASKIIGVELPEGLLEL